MAHFFSHNQRTCGLINKKRTKRRNQIAEQKLKIVHKINSLFDIRRTQNKFISDTTKEKKKQMRFAYHFNGMQLCGWHGNFMVKMGRT